MAKKIKISSVFFRDQYSPLVDGGGGGPIVYSWNISRPSENIIGGVREQGIADFLKAGAQSAAFDFSDLTSTTAHLWNLM